MENYNKFSYDGKYSFVDPGNRSTERYHKLVSYINKQTRNIKNKNEIDETQKIDKYINIFKKLLEDNFEIIFKDKNLKEDIIEGFPEMTPQLFEKIRK